MNHDRISISDLWSRMICTACSTAIVGMIIMRASIAYEWIGGSLFGAAVVCFSFGFMVSGFFLEWCEDKGSERELWFIERLMKLKPVRKKGDDGSKYWIEWEHVTPIIKDMIKRKRNEINK